VGCDDLSNSNPLCNGDTTTKMVPSNLATIISDHASTTSRKCNCC
jgi:hypothetical protein